MTEWFRSNKLSLNVSKTHAVMFKQGHMNIPSNLNVNEEILPPGGQIQNGHQLNENKSII